MSVSKFAHRLHSEERLDVGRGSLERVVLRIPQEEQRKS